MTGAPLTCPVCAPEHTLHIKCCACPEGAVRRYDYCHKCARKHAAIHEQLAKASKENELQRLVINDALARYDALYTGWRSATSNEDIADVVRRAMFNWEETRARLYDEHGNDIRQQLANAFDAIGSARALLAHGDTSAARVVLDDAMKGEAR